METLLFIDTNIFLDFYRVPEKRASLELLDLIDNNRDKIISSYQVEMEYKKNRQAVILQHYKELCKIKKWDIPILPAYIAKIQPTKSMKSRKKEFDDIVSKLNKRIKAILEKPRKYDIVFKVADRLFKSESQINLTRSKKIRYKIRNLARKRFCLGYPPRKQNDTSIGDSVNWEWIIHCAQSMKINVVIVSRDSDYGSVFEGNAILNDWLLKEFKERVSRKRYIALTDRLSEGFKNVGIKVKKKVEDDEIKLIHEYEQRNIRIHLDESEKEFISNFLKYWGKGIGEKED